MASQKPTVQAPAEPELLVDLPPEILAMMAAAGAGDDPEGAATETAQAGDEEAAETPELLVDLPPEILAIMAAGEAAAAGERAPAASPDEPAGEESRLRLAPVLDITAAAALHEALLSRRGTPVAIDAGEVKRLGGQCLQLLVSAGRSWAADGVPIRLASVSEAFRRDLAFMGLAPDALFGREAA